MIEINSGFYYVYSGNDNVFLMFYDEVTDRDYPICSCPNLSVADELVYLLQNNYTTLYLREGGIV